MAKVVAASAALLLLVLVSSPAAGAARGGTSGGRRAPGDSWLWTAADVAPPAALGFGSEPMKASGMGFGHFPPQFSSDVPRRRNLILSLPIFSHFP